MHLDILTLTVAGGFVALLGSLMIAGVWSQMPRSPALLWWAIGTFLSAAGIILLAVGGAGRMPVIMHAGIGFFVASAALVWGGVRIFCRRPAPLHALVAGVVYWLVITLTPLPEKHLWQTFADFLPTIIYLSAAIFELLRAPRENYPARWGLVAMFGIHVITFIGGLTDALSGRLAEGTLPALNTWFGIINFESLLYSIGTALFMVLIARERHEQEYIAASRKDSLTGIANRGALLEGGERLLKRCQQDGTSFSLIMFDLDHFKRVNDTYGHASGDAVLRAFADTCLAIVRPSDLLGRYGGEEFVVILPRATIEAAYVIADRIRNAFASARIATPGGEVKCTVSAGTAGAGSAAVTLEQIIQIADGCLYQAKALGRNRVERPAKTEAESSNSNVIRVA